MKVSLCLVFLPILFSGVYTEKATLCISTLVSPQCDAQANKWVEITDVVADSGCPGVTACDAESLKIIKSYLLSRCTGEPTCTFKQSELGKRCAAVIDYECIQGRATTPRIVNTDAATAQPWQKRYDSWQWAIIWIIIAVVLVAFIILVVMLVNRCCYKALNQEKPKFVESTPTHSNLGSTLNSRSVSMSTLHRPPVKKEVSQEEIDEVRAQFGTAKKKEKNMKHFGVGISSTLDSRRSSGDGASGEPNGKLYPGDDSSSGIGSVTYDSRLKHGLYNESDTCHDDFVSYTIKKQAKSPLVNPLGYNTLQNHKKVDENLYTTEAPTVDITEDRREEDFRLDINSWSLNRHRQQQPPREEPSGASTVTVDVEPAPSDIQLNPVKNFWTLPHENCPTDHFRTYSHSPTLKSSSLTDNNQSEERETLDYCTLQTKAKCHTVTEGLAYSTLPGQINRSGAEASKDNLMPDSANELKLDLSDLEPKFSYRQLTPSRRFYETFQTPRTDYVYHGHDSSVKHGNDGPIIHYYYPNKPLYSPNSQGDATLNLRGGSQITDDIYVGGFERTEIRYITKIQLGASS